MRIRLFGVVSQLIRLSGVPGIARNRGNSRRIASPDKRSATQRAPTLNLYCDAVCRKLTCRYSTRGPSLKAAIRPMACRGVTSDNSGANRRWIQLSLDGPACFCASARFRSSAAAHRRPIEQKYRRRTPMIESLPYARPAIAGIRLQSPCSSIGWRMKIPRCASTPSWRWSVSPGSGLDIGTRIRASIDNKPSNVGENMRPRGTGMTPSHVSRSPSRHLELKILSRRRRFGRGEYLSQP